MFQEMNKLLAALIMLLVSSAASASEFRHFSDWTTEEKMWFSSYSLLSYVDYKQTTWMLNQTNHVGEYTYEEKNPFLPKRVKNHQLAAAKVTSMMFQYWIVGKYGFEKETVKWGLIFNTVSQGAVVVRNHSIGININVAF